jgi:hypothetical protein
VLRWTVCEPGSICPCPSCLACRRRASIRRIPADLHDPRVQPGMVHHIITVDALHFSHLLPVSTTSLLTYRTSPSRPGHRYHTTPSPRVRFPAPASCAHCCLIRIYQLQIATHPPYHTTPPPPIRYPLPVFITSIIFVTSLVICHPKTPILCLAIFRRATRAEGNPEP